MYNLKFLDKLDEQTSKLVKQLIDLSPVGSMTLNDNFEIVSLNRSSKKYFDDDVRSTEKFFGNVFGCHYLNDNDSLCGTRRQCENCIIRNSMMNALKFNRVIKNVEVNKSFVINGVKKIMWFNMTFVPFEIYDKRYLWVSLIDLTDILKSKIETEINIILDDEKDILDKDKFHEDVMNYIVSNFSSGDVAYLMHIELKHSEDLHEKLGALWRNDYISSFKDFLIDHLDVTDFICRYSSNQFLIFLPCKADVDFYHLIQKIKTFQHKFIRLYEDVICRTIKFKNLSDKIIKIINTDQLYLEYFKAISQLEKLDEEEVYEIIL